MSALPVRVLFDGGSIPCLIGADDPAPRVLLRPVCEELGLDYEGQHERLARQPWAVVTEADDDEAAIDRVTFAMWLATISAGRFKQPDVRARIELYQREAVRALDRHVVGTSMALPAVELIAELVERQIACERRLAALEGSRNGECAHAPVE